MHQRETFDWKYNMIIGFNGFGFLTCNIEWVDHRCTTRGTCGVSWNCFHPLPYKYLATFSSSWQTSECINITRTPLTPSFSLKFLREARAIVIPGFIWPDFSRETASKSVAMSGCQTVASEASEPGAIAVLIAATLGIDLQDTVKSEESHRLIRRHSTQNCGRGNHERRSPRRRHSEGRFEAREREERSPGSPNSEGHRSRERKTSTNTYLSVDYTPQGHHRAHSPRRLVSPSRPHGFKCCHHCLINKRRGSARSPQRQYDRQKSNEHNGHEHHKHRHHRTHRDSI